MGTGYLLFLDVLEIIVIPCKIRVRDLCKTERKILCFWLSKNLNVSMCSAKSLVFKKIPTKKREEFQHKLALFQVQSCTRLRSVDSLAKWIKYSVALWGDVPSNLQGCKVLGSLVAGSKFTEILKNILKLSLKMSTGCPFYSSWSLVPCRRVVPPWTCCVTSWDALEWQCWLSIKICWWSWKSTPECYEYTRFLMEGWWMVKPVWWISRILYYISR